MYENTEEKEKKSESWEKKARLYIIFEKLHHQTRSVGIVKPNDQVKICSYD